MINKIWIAWVLALLAATIAIGCQSDASRIRATNEAIDRPNPTATSAPMPTATSESLSADIRSVDIQEGDCINSTLPEGITFYSVDIVPCTDAWQYRTLNLISIKRSGGYPGIDYFLQQALEGCDPRVTAYVYPLSEAWEQGERRIACLQDSFGLSQEDPEKLDRLFNPYSLNVGDCFNLAVETGGRLAELVSCSGEWDYRALNSFEVDIAGNYPGEEALRAQALIKCDRRSNIPYIPPLESWELGERTVLCAQDSFGLSMNDTIKLDHLVASTSLRGKECFNEAPETEGVAVELVDCSGEWDFRVISSFDGPDSTDYPGEQALSQLAYENCGRHSSTFIYPFEESWRVGDRTINCLQDSFGLSISNPLKLDRLVTYESLLAGECYNEASETNYYLAELVSCSSEWEYRVTSRFEITGRGSFPGEDFIEQEAHQRCEEPYDIYIPPTPETWESGDRLVLCLEEGF